MQTVTVGSEDYASYASVDQADVYLMASLHAGTTWSDATDDTKGQALVTATRILDRQRWLPEYDTQAEREDVQAIQDANCEMALALLQGSDFQTESSTAQKLQSITAGSVSLTYFASSSTSVKRFPTIVWELLRDYMAGVGVGLGSVATGTGGVSSTADDFGHSDPV
jgi:hypothetical protein